ncbi:MAG: aspartate aminotransferase family protein [Pseudomonadota bacterium]
MPFDDFKSVLFPTYAKPDLDFVRGIGAELETSDGRRYLDFIGGIAVNCLGHAHPALTAALKGQADKLWHLSNMFAVPGQRELAARYCQHSFADAAFFTNSGTEAVECALKAARRFHHVNGEPQRTEIISFEGAFHGRSYGAMNAAANPRYLEGFGPKLPGYVQCPFGDLSTLEQLIQQQTAAVIVEPIQGEGGVRPLDASTLTELRSLCSAKGVLLIYDEVQCGAGRTGKLFAHQWADHTEPDIMALAKGIGGGFPFGLCLARQDVADSMTFGTHGTTYGGNALAVAVGHAVLDVLLEPGFLEHVQTLHSHFVDSLRRLGDAVPDIELEVRGRGLLIGVKSTLPNTDIRNAARDRELLVGVAGDNVVRMAPPLNISTRDIDRAVTILHRAFLDVRQGISE